MKLHRKCCVLAFALLVSFDLFSQESASTQDSIVWSKDYRLKWSDFAGKVDDSSSFSAACAASLYVKGFVENGLPNFSVSNSFIRSSAWTKDTALLILLRHEQLHFDIAEIHARKIRKAVDSLRRKNVKAVEIYSMEIRKLLRMRSEMDRVFDDQTSHGINGNLQADWNKKILRELESLHRYATKLF